MTRKADDRPRVPAQSAALSHPLRLCQIPFHVRAVNLRPQKHSLTLKGHRTSVTLEPAFWDAFRDIARKDGKPINVLASEIDEARGTDTGLASAIRVYVLSRYRG